MGKDDADLAKAARECVKTYSRQTSFGGHPTINDEEKISAGCKRLSYDPMCPAEKNASVHPQIDDIRAFRTRSAYIGRERQTVLYLALLDADYLHVYITQVAPLKSYLCSRGRGRSRMPPPSTTTTGIAAAATYTAGWTLLLASPVAAGSGDFIKHSKWSSK